MIKETLKISSKSLQNRPSRCAMRCSEECSAGHTKLAARSPWHAAAALRAPAQREGQIFLPLFLASRCRRAAAPLRSARARLLAGKRKEGKEKEKK